MLKDKPPKVTAAPDEPRRRPPTSSDKVSFSSGRARTPTTIVAAKHKPAPRR